MQTIHTQRAVAQAEKALDGLGDPEVLLTRLAEACDALRAVDGADLDPDLYAILNLAGLHFATAGLAINDAARVLRKVVATGGDCITEAAKRVRGEQA